MNFQEAEKKASLLQDQLKRGQITREQYISSVNGLRVTDSQGRWWQPDPSGPGWLFWDGSAWQKGNPPVQMPAQARAGGGGAASGSVSEFRDQMIDFKTFRQISKDLPLAQRPQKWWDFFSILGGVIGAVIWFFYSIEDIDLITPLIIIALPVLLVMFRKNIDGFLQPLQATRKKIPVMILVGISIALPFLTAFIFYNVFGISEYSLIRVNMIIGVLAGYALIRNPEPSTGVPKFSGKGLPVLALLLFTCMMVGTVVADDCARDPFRAEDCLRTGGFAETIAGVATVAVVVLVNGAEVVRTIYKTPKTSEDQEDKVFTVVVSTRDPAGNTSTTLDMVNSPSIFFYAHCEEVGKGRFPSGDDTIRFALQSAHTFITLTDLGMKQGERCAQVTFKDPQPEGDLPDTADVMVSAGIGQNTIPVTVTLSLKGGMYELEVY
ncbi:MAG: DUF2510 domain-containing protein [Methanoregulaceae archaeon]|jgi:hypothetical protein|nr:DUF2510 domain-containing protein [Methanoregulaceae archaeon]